MKSRNVLLIAAFIIAGMVAQAQIKPTFNPAQGQKYTYRTATDQKIVTSFAGQQMVMNTVTEMLTEISVKEKTNNEVKLDLTYKEIVMTLSSAMMNFKIDTKNKVGNTEGIEKIGADLFNCIIGKTLQIVVDPNGSVKSLTGYNAIMSEIEKVLLPLGDMGQQMGLFTQAFSEEAIKTTFEQTYTFYPDKEIKIGESWNKDNKFSMAGMEIEAKTSYTIKSVSNDIAVVGVASVMTMKTGGETEGEMKGDQKGEMRLGVKTGMPMQSTSEGSIKGTIKQQGMEVAMEITTKVTTNLQQ